MHSLFKAKLGKWVVIQVDQVSANGGWWKEILRKEELLFFLTTNVKVRNVKLSLNKTGVINDPLGQTHNHANSEHCFHFVLFCYILKSGDDMCENNDPYRPWLWVGRVDQLCFCQPVHTE